MKPISKTAFYCCGVRMQDAESSNPICGDVYAASWKMMPKVWRLPEMIRLTPWRILT